MATAFGKIRAWNEERGLLSKGYDHKNEVSFIIEELIEGTKDVESLRARKYAKWITKIILWVPGINASKEMMVDAFADIIVFAAGAIYKLGFDTDKVMKEVQKELNDRSGNFIDGKFIKDIKETPYKANFSKCNLS